MNTQHASMRRIARAILLLAVCLAGPGRAAAANSFSEPHTVFYGKVIGTGSAQPFLITEGVLLWTITRSDGSTVTLRTSLYAYEDNTCSYLLEVPHSALALGLTPDVASVPMPALPLVNVHSAVTVDGEPAELLGPAGSAFVTEQMLRTAAYRLDLGVTRAAADSDGDGMADWWEDAHGLDKQDASDATSDANGDGVSALDAYRRGLDPAADARAPTILTRELVVYPAGTTAVLLDVADTDSAPSQIVCTVTALPSSGTVALRNAQPDPLSPDAVLTVGASFTQADLLAGRLVYEGDAAAGAPGWLGLAVRDENADRAPAQARILLLAYEPGDYAAAQPPESEVRRLLNHFYATCGFIVMDAVPLPAGVSMAAPGAGLSGSSAAAYRADYGEDRACRLVAAENGAAAGGLGDDVLSPGGGTASLTGGDGADTFLFRAFGAGRVVVTDFSVAQGDVLDLSGLSTSGGYVHDWLNVTAVPGGFELRADLDGNGAGFTNLTVALPGLAAADADLYALVQAGRVLVGDLQLLPRLTVTATIAEGAENGPTPAQFTVTRQGSLADALSVNLTLTGTALNGVDYAFVPATLLLPAGAASATIGITPYADGVIEAAESVQLLLAAGTGYAVGAAGQATVTIQDFRMLVAIDVLEAVAVKESGRSALVSVTRRDIINRDVLIRLDIGGTATNGKDYQSVAGYVYMAVNQTTAFIHVTPLATAILSGGTESVRIAIQPDPAYLASGTGAAQVAIIEREDSFAAWYAREFENHAQPLTVFAGEDSGGTGVSHFQRYAYGLDPHQPATDGMPRPFFHQGRLTVTFRRPLGRQDVRYTVTAMTNLRNRTGSQVPVASIAAPDGSSDPERVYYQVAPAAAGTPAAFVEVKAEWTP